MLSQFINFNSIKQASKQTKQTTSNFIVSNLMRFLIAVIYSVLVYDILHWICYASMYKAEWHYEKHAHQIDLIWLLEMMTFFYYCTTITRQRTTHTQTSI